MNTKTINVSRRMICRAFYKNEHWVVIVQILNNGPKFCKNFKGVSLVFINISDNDTLEIRHMLI